MIMNNTNTGGASGGPQVDRILSEDDSPTASVPPAGEGGGNCSASITGNGSVSSASTATKTRFSFYNAQEVSSVEQNLQGSKQGPVAGDKGSQKRFNFYVPDQVQVPKEQRSPSSRHSPAQQAPAAVVAVVKKDKSKPSKHFTCTSQSQSSGSSSSSRSKTKTTTTLISGASNTSNTVLTSPSNRGTGINTSMPKRTPTPRNLAKTSKGNTPSDNTPVTKNLKIRKGAAGSTTGSAKADSNEILRSLKDTEEMRNTILEQANAALSPKTDPIPIPSALSPREHQPLPTATTTHLPHVNGNSQAYPVSTSTAQADTASCITSANNNNPYEDAIREALDLLRKHRPPVADAISVAGASTISELTGGPAAPASATGVPGSTRSSGGDHSGAADLPLTLRTPPETDPVLQSRMVDLDASGAKELADTPTYQADIEARRKQRQERMARYASRLAELKNEPIEKNSSSVTSAPQSQSQFQSQTQSQSPPSPAHQLQSSNISLGSQSYQGGASVLSGADLSLDATSSLTSCKQVDEVQRSVERVLLAILERANSVGRERPPSATVDNSELIHHGQSAATPSPAHPTIWQKGEEKKSLSVDESDSVSQASAPNSEVDADPLARVVGELLSTSSNGITSFPDTIVSSFETAPSTLSAALSAKPSVVEELLAEPEPMFFPATSSLQVEPLHINHMQTQSSAPSSETDDIMVPTHNTDSDFLNSSSGIEQLTSIDDMRSSLEGFDELDRLASPKTTDEEDVEETEEEDLDEDEENDIIEDEDISYDAEEDMSNDALDGVLGPLSKKAGGTTGVVLESSSPTHAQTSPEASIFDSLANTMSSLVAQAMNEDQKISMQAKASIRDKYSTDLDEDDGEAQVEETDDESDSEANDLMRTLCAHLLPFGVDQSSQLLDKVPLWDDHNPNEAGYRIIRLTNHQLRRVEIAFDNMVNGLRQNSEQRLKQINGEWDRTRDGSDLTFERELEAVEELLDREEKRKETVMKARNIVKKSNQRRAESLTQVDSQVQDTDEGSSQDDDSSSEEKDDLKQESTCHPDFPAVHRAGKGEMGDLEYFHLPIIFKSHVTGFEPTKDLYLEAGNVVAGQYLVESELGSAAFSTAYRCVDLYSDAAEDEGHEEVCLKVIKNTKDFFDQSLDEIKILELLRQTGRCNDNYIIEMKTFFYHREHLIIVTELLRQNLFEFGKFILDHDEEPYFTLQRLGYITRQVLIALKFVHKLGLVHSDVKPENILLGSYSRAQVKLIDFGSSCYLTDRQSSYIQSRSYRAPEVVLGLPYDGRIDVWSLGCVVAEMYTGEVTFQNDSVVSMLSRIEAICGPFPRHMIAQGRQSRRFFTKCGLLYEKVADHDHHDGGHHGGDNDDTDSEGSRTVFDIFQPKVTTLSARMGFEPDLMERHGNDLHREDVMFVDFVRKLLTIDPESRPTAAEALEHPWMVLSASLEEEDIKYPSQ